MMSQRTTSLGQSALRLLAMIARPLALAIFPLALAPGLALGMTPAASAAPTSARSCGSANSGCGPPNCRPLTPHDFTLPTTSPLGSVRASLSRTAGVAGSSDTLSGSGWPARATVLLFVAMNQGGDTLWLNPNSFAQGIAGANGRLTIADFHTPNMGECLTNNGQDVGPNPALFVAQSSDGAARVSLPYTFNPMPTVLSQHGPMVSAAESVFATGAGWEPGQVVTITPVIGLWPSDSYLTTDPVDFQRLPLAASSVKAIYDGTFATTLTIPPEPPETEVTFFATANGPINGDVSVQMSDLFTVLPARAASVSLSADAAEAGGALTITGANWPAGQAVQIEYCRGQDTPRCPYGTSEGLALVYADTGGRIAAAIHLPDDARPGPITIQVRALFSPFGDGSFDGGQTNPYERAIPFQVIYPFAKAHPRLQMAINASPVAVAGVVIGLLALLDWRRKRRGATALTAE